MEIKDIKAGETYNMRVKVIYVDSDAKCTEIGTIPVDKNGKELEREWAYYGSCTASALSPITPENGTKNTESAPKYDPCRKFRKGDIVTPKVINGRFFDKFTKEFVGLKCEVLQDEEEFEYVIIRANDERSAIDVAYLELVTPVEELEPYRVETGRYNRFRIKKGNLEYSYFPFGEHCVLSMEEAKAAAEAECDRLNAKHRKEMGK